MIFSDVIWSEFKLTMVRSLPTMSFKEYLYVCGIQIKLSAPVQQEIYYQVEVMWRTLITIAHCKLSHTHLGKTHGFCISK